MKVHKQVLRRAKLNTQYKKVSKIVLISLLVSLNVCVWKDILGDAFYEVGFGAVAAILGMLLFSTAYRSWRRL